MLPSTTHPACSSVLLLQWGGERNTILGRMKMDFLLYFLQTHRISIPVRGRTRHTACLWTAVFMKKSGVLLTVKGFSESYFLFHNLGHLELITFHTVCALILGVYINPEAMAVHTISFQGLCWKFQKKKFWSVRAAKNNSVGYVYLGHVGSARQRLSLLLHTSLPTFL